jgi:hypothetical protein
MRRAARRKRPLFLYGEANRIVSLRQPFSDL